MEDINEKDVSLEELNIEKVENQPIVPDEKTISEVENVANQTVPDIEYAAEQATLDLENAAKKASTNLEGVADKAVQNVEYTANKSVENVQYAANLAEGQDQIVRNAEIQSEQAVKDAQIKVEQKLQDIQADADKMMEAAEAEKDVEAEQIIPEEGVAVAGAAVISSQVVEGQEAINLNGDEAIVENNLANIEGVEQTSAMHVQSRRFKTIDGQPIQRYKNPKNKEVIAKAEKAREQGKEINGALKEPIAKTGIEEKEVNVVEGVEIPTDSVAAAEIANDLAKQASEAKIEMMENQLKTGSIAPDAKEYAEVLEMQRQSEVVIGNVMDSGEKLDTESANKMKEEEIKTEKSVSKMNEKITEEANEKLKRVESLENSIQKNNSLLRCGEISQKEYSEKSTVLQQQISDAKLDLANVNISEMEGELDQNAANREMSEAVLGDRHEQINNTLLNKDTIDMSNEVSSQSMEVENEIKENIEDLNESSIETDESYNKTEAYLNNKASEHAEGSKERVMAEAEINQINTTRASRSVTNEAINNGKVKSKDMQKIEEYTQANKEQGGIVEQLADSNKICQSVEDQDKVLEVAEAQQNREVIETNEQVVQRSSATEDVVI